MTARTQLEKRLTELEDEVRPAQGDAERPMLSTIAGTVLSLTASVRELIDSESPGDAELAVCAAMEAMRHAAEFWVTAGIPDAERCGLGSIAWTDEELARLIEFGRDKRQAYWSPKRRRKWEAMQHTADDLRQRHPEWSASEVRRHVAQTHQVSIDTVKRRVKITAS